MVAQIQGNSALSGASGATIGEFIAQEMYPGVKRGDLTEEQRQTISSLSTLAAGLAGGLTGDSSANVLAGAQAGKNAVENNRLSNTNEKQIISNLAEAGHDPHKLDAASCALIKCYAEYPIGSAEYEKNFALAQEGDKYQQEQQFLKNYQLLTTELQDPLYWNKVPEEVKVKYQGFEYSQADQVADGQKAYDAWKIGYIADKLGVSPGAVELTSTGFNIGLIVAGTSEAGKVAGSNPGQTVSAGDAGKGTTAGETAVGATSREALSGPTANWKNYTHAEAVTQTSSSGRLVNADNAIIDPNKLTSYALNTEHPVGGNKAKVFESALGYNQSNATDLIAKVQEGAKSSPAKLGTADKFGQRVTIDMPITGPNGNTVTVRTGWIYDPGSSTPRMTTTYVK